VAARATRGEAAAWALAGAAACALMAPLEPSLLEEGMALHFAERMAAGERLFHDLVLFTGPLPFEALAALFRAFGAEIAVARTALAVLHGGACASLFALGHAAGGRPAGRVAAALGAAAPAALFPFWSIWFYTALAAQLAWIAAALGLLAVNGAGGGVAAGLAVAAVALCKQPVGLALAPALLLAVALRAPAGRRLRRAAAVGAGGAAAAAATLAFYAARGDVGALVHQMVVLPLSFGETYQLPYVNLWPPGLFARAVAENQAYYLPLFYSLVYGVVALAGPLMTFVTQLLYATPFAALAATAVARALGPLSPGTVLHAAVLLALLTNVFPRTDWGHLVYVLPAALVQLALLAFGRPPDAGPPGRLARAGAGVLVGALALAAAGFAWIYHAAAGPPTWGPRVPLRPVSPAYQAANYPDAIAFVRDRLRPGEAIFVPRAEPLLYFATGARNPTPYPGVIPGYREEQEPVILRALADVRFVLMSDIDQPVYTYYRDELPRVQEALERHYRVAGPFRDAQHSVLLVLERGADRGPTAVDLVARAGEAARFALDASGRPAPPPPPPPRMATRHNRTPLPVALGPRGGGLDLRVVLPEGARLELDYGIGEMRAVRRYRHPAPVRLRVAVDAGDGFASRAEVDVGAGGETWTPLAVDLADLAGREVVLRFAFASDAPIPPRRRLAWLGSPRLVAR
jgi:hypothetical protein